MTEIGVVNGRFQILHLKPYGIYSCGENAL